MSPVEPPVEVRKQIEEELERNRRWEYRLPVYAGVALLVSAVIVIVRVVFLHV
ncbi:hypothetical protein [Leifsonia virtsii]|uniref:Uncharacterized protein n=1 Tax=Leifsonia virtsii TaxID=3035915 RepID=A0ABT8IV07_9MICO|nr:hypothetical protein [Leifsonia virtsii]MDN4596649.1 hypothetical protein [Leifsonia virtsii]